MQETPKVELTADLCLKLHAIINKMPREQINALMNEFEKQLDEHNKKILDKKEEK
jgi:hypothetical protein